MNIVYTVAQRLHDPAFQQSASGRTAHPEREARFDALIEVLAYLPHIEAEPADGDALTLVHTADYVDYLRGAYSTWVDAGHNPEAVLPAAFASRGGARRPEEVQALSGWYGTDTFTPIVAGTFEAACASAGAALTGARLLLGGERAVYALCRPPGHHAGPDYFGGFCYFNNAAIATAWLSRETDGRVAVLDLDYHHGNGTQHVFYETDAALFVSIHADPRVEFPYYSGNADETGTGRGLGYTMNLPLAPLAGEAVYGEALRRALGAIDTYAPDFLLVSFGSDVCRGDIEGHFDLDVEYLGDMAVSVRGLGLPTLVVQEGGYTIDVLQAAAAQFIVQFA